MSFPNFHQFQEDFLKSTLDFISKCDLLFVKITGKVPRKYQKQHYRVVTRDELQVLNCLIIGSVPELLAEIEQDDECLVFLFDDLRGIMNSTPIR